VAEKTTNDLLALVIAASSDVVLIRGKLARDEVFDYRSADLLGIEVLPMEAQRLGESTRKAPASFKKADLQLIHSASAKRSRLRTAAKKDAVLAAGLNAKLQGLRASAQRPRRRAGRWRTHLFDSPACPTARPRSSRSAPLLDFGSRAGRGGDPRPVG
jgi:hypothetical protein